MLTLSSAKGLIATAEPQIEGRDISYTSPLAAGAVQPGDFLLSFAGGANVGAFQAAFKAGFPIQITSQFPKGTSLGQQVTVNWTGGQPGETVTLKVSEAEFRGRHVYVTQAPATAGTITLRGLPLPGIPGGYQNILHRSSDVEIDIEVGPDPAKP